MAIPTYDEHANYATGAYVTGPEGSVFMALRVTRGEAPASSPEAWVSLTSDASGAAATAETKAIAAAAAKVKVEKERAEGVEATKANA